MEDEDKSLQRRELSKGARKPGGGDCTATCTEKVLRFVLMSGVQERGAWAAGVDRRREHW